MSQIHKQHLDNFFLMQATEFKILIKLMRIKQNHAFWLHIMTIAAMRESR
jgi:hypothetical protein